MRLRALVLMALASCMGTVPPRPDEVRPLPPLPRSSIAAVLEHADELALTDEQLNVLEAAEGTLAAEIEAARAQRPTAGVAPAPTPPKGRAQQGYEGALAPGMGSGDARGYDVARRKRRSGPAVRAGPLEARFDDLDTAAMLGVEHVFTPAQHALAMGFASAYRAAVVERRAQ